MEPIKPKSKELKFRFIPQTFSEWQIRVPWELGSTSLVVLQEKPGALNPCPIPAPEQALLPTQLPPAGNAPIPHSPISPEPQAASLCCFTWQNPKGVGWNWCRNCFKSPPCLCWWISGCPRLVQQGESIPFPTVFALPSLTSPHHVLPRIPTHFAARISLLPRKTIPTKLLQRQVLNEVRRPWADCCSHRSSF